MCISQLRTTDPNSWAFLKRATDYPERGQGGGREGGGAGGREVDKHLLSTEHLGWDGIVEKEIKEVRFTSLKVYTREPNPWL